MTPQTFLTAAACDISRISRQQFNDIVQSGVYTLAPDVELGNHRHFNRDDLMFLYVCGSMLRVGIPPRMAGRLASAFGELLKKRNAESGYWFLNLKKQQKSADIVLLIGTEGSYQADFWGDTHELKFSDGEKTAMRLIVDVAVVGAAVDAGIKAHLAKH